MKIEDFTAHLYHYRAVVIGHTDGDSFRVRLRLGDDVERQRNIRVFGLKCPEIRTRDLAEKARGLESAEFAATILPLGTNIYLRSYKDSKSADRLVCEVYYSVEDYLYNFAEVMVKYGYGEWDPRWVKVESHKVAYRSV